MKTLPLLDFEPRQYQNDFFADVMQQLDSGEPKSHLYASPTGTGKSVMELMLHTWLPEAVLVTPRLEIIAGMLQKVGIDCRDWSSDRLAAEALEYRITTPIRLRNQLASGDLPWRPNAIIWDEAHHRSADSWTDVRAYLPGVPEIGLTASPFRGTPKGTEEFLETWDTLTWIMDYPTAAREGYIAVPSWTIWPLVNDDRIEVVNGEIKIAAASEAVINVIQDVAQRCVQFRRERALPSFGNPHVVPCWDRPTLFAVPDTASALQLAAALVAAGLPASAVTQDTPRATRNDLFRMCEAAETAIVQIDVVSEGVDLKLRRLIDLRPTLSPVKWLQQIGRITRPTKPGEAPPEYICCNRNLERHAYLYDGLIPPAAVASAQEAFQGPTSRAGLRAVGIEGMGRFAGVELPLADGTRGLMYNLTTVEGTQKREYAVLMHPCSLTPIYAARQNERGPDGMTVTYGKWREVERLPDLKGFNSAPPSKLSPKQAEWWERSAETFGLDPKACVNRKNFAALPILKDIRKPLTPGVM